MLHILYCNYYVVINRNGGYNAGIYCIAVVIILLYILEVLVHEEIPCLPTFLFWLIHNNIPIPNQRNNIYKRINNKFFKAWLFVINNYKW